MKREVKQKYKATIFYTIRAVRKIMKILYKILYQSINTNREIYK